MSLDSENSDTDICFRCKRDLSGEAPVLLPDGCQYCAACCEFMATDEFEMQLGERFVPWIEKHSELVMQHQPMEIRVRRSFAVVTAIMAGLGLVLALFGIWTLSHPGDPFVPMSPEMLAKAPEERGPKPMPPPSGLSYIFLGLGAAVVFGWIGFSQARAYLLASGYCLKLKDGTFHLVHGGHEETFHINDIKQACVVRPGTVGATKGALGLKDGRMLTLDTCLTDLHALGVIMDLRFRDDFPPTLEEAAAERREKLRKIRGLS